MRLVRVKNFHFFITFESALGPTQTPIQLIPETLSAAIQRDGHEVDHSRPTSAVVKNT
jgi:hypothetical protein